MIESKEFLKLKLGAKVHSNSLNKNLIVGYYIGTDKVSNLKMWVCIDPNISMNDDKNRCELFYCTADELEIGWK